MNDLFDKILRLIGNLFLHAITFFVGMLLLIAPSMTISDIRSILLYEVPLSSGGAAVYALLGLWVYLMARVPYMRKLYGKVTILIPLLQMMIFTGLCMEFGKHFVNRWADDAVYSKETAVLLMIAAIIAGRICMSVLYRMFPLSVTMRDLIQSQRVARKNRGE